MPKKAQKKFQNGDPSVSAAFVGYVKKVKNERGPFGDKKISKKVAQCRKKIERGDSLVPSGFVEYLEKVKIERGDPLHSVCFGPLDGLGALGGFRIVSKKWTDQFEDCSLKKKQAGSAQVGAISKAKKYQKDFKMSKYW